MAGMGIGPLFWFVVDDVGSKMCRVCLMNIGGIVPLRCINVVCSLF